MSTNTKQLMSTSEVANYLQVSYSTVRRLLYDGKLTAFKIRGNIRFSLNDINCYLDNSRIGGDKN
jgi:excisionase family DNA binding protein